MPPKTSFGYVEREADSYVNWADVGRTITNTVDEIDRVRTEKKAAIDAAYKEELQRINDKPIGQKDDVNKWTINMAYNAAENLKIQHNLLKSGKLQVKDYAIYLQNTSDSIKNLYGTIGQIQTAFQERIERQAKGENQKIEMWDGQDLEQYGKLTDLGANFNINGNLTFSRLETVTEDGKTITRAKPGSENLLSVNQLAGAVSTKYNYYDYLKDADDFISRLGEGITAYRTLGSENRAGSITQITDKSGVLDLQKAKDLGLSPEEIERIQGVVSEYSKAEEAYINAALNPKYNKSSILTEELGYTPTDDAKEAAKDPNLMLVQRETDGTITPIIPEGSDQEKAAREFLRGQYRQMIDKKLEISPYPEPTPPRVQPVYDAGARGAAAYLQKVKMYHKLFVGSPGEMNLALQNVKTSNAVDASLTKYDPNTQKLTITPKDVTKPPIIYDFKNPDPNVSMQDLVFSVLDLVDPASNSKYGGEISKYSFSKVTPNTNMPYDDLIRESKDRYQGYLDEARKYGPKTKERAYYMSSAVVEKKTLDDLEKKQAAQRQGQTTGKAPRK